MTLHGSPAPDRVFILPLPLRPAYSEGWHYCLPIKVGEGRVLAYSIEHMDHISTTLADLLIIHEVACLAILIFC